jgi:hypothetical protein
LTEASDEADRVVAAAEPLDGPATGLILSGVLMTRLDLRARLRPAPELVGECEARSRAHATRLCLQMRSSQPAP